jgi:hypothetical protein
VALLLILLVSLAEAEAIWLEREFEEKEVLEVMKAMNCDKA